MTEMIKAYKTEEEIDERITIEKMKDRIKDICKADYVIVTSTVRRDVKELIGLDIK